MFTKEKICFTYDELIFIMSELNDTEKNIILKILVEKDRNFFIGWLRESIENRKNYSKSRSENRKRKEVKTFEPLVKSKIKKIKKICQTYLNHMINIWKMKMKMKIKMKKEKGKKGAGEKGKGGKSFNFSV